MHYFLKCIISSFIYHHKICRSLTSLEVVLVVVYVFSWPHSFSMAGVVPKALILGHSFVKKLDRDLWVGFDVCAARDFNGMACND